MAIKNRIGQLARERGMKTATLAQQAQITFNTAQSMMRGGTKRIDLDVLERICRVLEVTPGDVLVLEPDPA